jgi:hypothetical protein
LENVLLPKNPRTEQDCYFIEIIAEKFSKVFQSASNPSRNIGINKISAKRAFGFAKSDLLFHFSIDAVIANKLAKQAPNPTNIPTTTEFNHSGPLKKS